LRYAAPRNSRLRNSPPTVAFATALALLVALLLPLRCAAYAVLAHEAIIDTVWDTNLQPLLLKRFPQATPDDLRKAHGYAYGGAIIQDMGYYPHGSHLFSDLLHYVRSADFVIALLHDSKDINDYAFALGALAHYAADNAGHSIGTNHAVPILYPKLQKKYGDVVTYEQDPLAHVKTEFGFDVIEVAQNRYASDAYHDFIGFNVAVPLLEQAFRDTYGLEIKSVLPNEEQALNSYRRAVSQQLPKATRIAWSLKSKDIQKDTPSMTKKKFLYNLSRSSYEKEWGKEYQQPTPGEKFLAFLLKILPKIGPLKVLQFRAPTPETEKMFEASFNSTLDHYRKLLAEVGRDDLVIANDNFDTGSQTGPGKYKLNDDTYARLLDKLAKEKFVEASPELRANILAFYSDPNAPYATKRHPKAWAKVQTDLTELKAAPPPPPGAPGTIPPPTTTPSN
jgi:hypothetical protein